MHAFYDATILLNLGLIAIVVATFVLGASLLGRAIKEFSETEENTLKAQKEQLGKDIENLKIQVNKIKASNDTKTLKNKLGELENIQRKNELELRQIRTKPKLLTVNGSVVYPAALFLVSLFLSVGAKLFPQAWLSIPIWLLSIIFVGFGCYRVYQSLGVIEKVAITTEQAYLRSTKEAFEAALESREEAKRPLLELEFLPEKPPFTLKPDSIHEIKYVVQLKKGDFVEDTEVRFYVPDGFDFPGLVKSQTGSGSFFAAPNMSYTVVSVGTVKLGLFHRLKINIKTPTKSGTYTIIYFINGKGFASEKRDFIIEVK